MRAGTFRQVAFSINSDLFETFRKFPACILHFRSTQKHACPLGVHRHVLHTVLVGVDDFYETARIRQAPHREQKVIDVSRGFPKLQPSVSGLF